MFENYLGVLRKFINLAEKHDAKVIFLVQSQGTDSKNNILLTSLSQKAKKKATELGAIVIDTREIVDEYKGDKKELVLELSKDKFDVNKKEVSLDDFSNVIKSYKDPKIAVDFRVDKDVVYDRIVKVLSVLQQNNLTNLSLVTSKL